MHPRNNLETVEGGSGVRKRLFEMLDSILNLAEAGLDALVVSDELSSRGSRHAVVEAIGTLLGSPDESKLAEWRTRIGDTASSDKVE